MQTFAPSNVRWRSMLQWLELHVDRVEIANDELEHLRVVAEEIEQRCLEASTEGALPPAELTQALDAAYMDLVRYVVRNDVGLFQSILVR